MVSGHLEGLSVSFPRRDVSHHHPQKYQYYPVGLNFYSPNGIRSLVNVNYSLFNFGQSSHACRSLRCSSSYMLAVLRESFLIRNACARIRLCRPIILSCGLTSHRMIGLAFNSIKVGAARHSFLHFESQPSKSYCTFFNTFLLLPRTDHSFTWPGYSKVHGFFPNILFFASAQGCASDDVISENCRSLRVDGVCLAGRDRTSSSR